MYVSRFAVHRVQENFFVPFGKKLLNLDRIRIGDTRQTNHEPETSRPKIAAKRIPDVVLASDVIVAGFKTSVGKGSAVTIRS